MFDYIVMTASGNVLAGFRTKTEAKEYIRQLLERDTGKEVFLFTRDFS